jgi:two-component system chemotaxis sensor kinase CheA
MDDLIVEFLAETNESLTELDKDLVRLEQNPNDADLLSKIFRIMHTIKGTCGFLGLGRLEKVAHAGENILGKFRDKELPVNDTAVTLVLETLDTIKIIIEGLETTGAEPEGDDSSIKQRISDYIASGGTAGAAPSAPPAPMVFWAGESEEEIAANLAAEFAATKAAEKEFAEKNAAKAAPAAAATPAPVVAPVAVAKPAPAKVEAKAEAKAPAGEGAGTANQSIRVNVELLEDLMTVVSELVLTRNQLLQILRTQNESPFANALQRLNFNVSELQEGVMKTRMQPIGNAWQKLPRIVRDLCLELGKDIDLVMTGEETELDRQVLELIKDPLTHMVRNSADHGVEIPADRKASGKPEKGHIWLSAYHEGGHIIIQIKDDGKGLNTKRIREKAIQNKLMTEEEANAAPVKQLHMLIFAAGFSTAAAVTAVSGRGVGMDVVRSNIEKIGGTVDLNSIEGEGTTFTIKIPLTLAIVSALIVEAGGERFAVPQISVRELVRASQTGENRIETIQGAPVLRLRNRLLPLVNLTSLLQLSPPAYNDPNIVSLDAARRSKTGNPYIIVTQVGSYMFGIMVDQVFDTEEIVVKPVSPILRNLEIFSGNTILGDGSVIMILDPNGIAKMSGQSSSAGTAPTHADDAAAAQEQKVTMLVFRAGAGAPKAVPLALVGRLEELAVKTIETSDSQYVVQYRGELMPLLPFDEKMTLKADGTQSVIVFFENGRHLGLLVNEIVDIVEETLHVSPGHGTPGVMGSAIINGKATDVIDVGYYVERGHGDWFGTKGDASKAFGEVVNRSKVLLVDDSTFFRNMLEPLLDMAGYQVTSVDSPRKALELRDKGMNFDLIVSDIEMPDMNGFDFAAACRATDKWRTTPIVALSSHATSEDIERGKQAGFTDHLPKFDRDTLLEAIANSLSRHKKGEAA